MRKILISLIIIAGLIIMTAPAFASNYYENSQFESGSTGWQLIEIGGTTGTYVGTSTTYAHSGTIAGYTITDTSSNSDYHYGMLVQNLNLYGKSTISVWVYSPTSNDNPSFQPLLVYRETGQASNGYKGTGINPHGTPSTSKQYLQKTTPPEYGTWIQISWNIAGSLGAQDHYHDVMLFGETSWNGAGRIMYFDDILIDGVGYSYTPVANFTATPVSGSKPLQVIFNDTSSNTPTSWLWDFGDGVTSTAQNPIHTYTTAGTYNVSHYAANTAGSDWENRTSYITVNEQAGAFNGYFELTGTYSYDQGWPSVSFDALLTEIDPLDQYDQIVWYLDGSRISNADISGSWVQHVELKKTGASWQTLNPNTYSWTATATPLQNEFHFHNAGSHVIRAMVLYQNVTVADVSLTVTANMLGLYSSNIVAVRNSNGALIPGSTVGYYDLTNGDHGNWTLPLGQITDAVLINGHTYRFTAAATGYTSINDDRQWANLLEQDFVLYNNSVVPANPDNIYVHVKLSTVYNGMTIPVNGQITLTSASNYYPYTVSNNGVRDIEVTKNTYFTYVATAGGYETVSGSFVTGTDNYDLPITLPFIQPVITPTPPPYQPTAIPTSSTGAVLPGYPQYNDEERGKVIEGGIDQWIGALPGLIDLIILVCICTLIGMIGTGLNPKKKR